MFTTTQDLSHDRSTVFAWHAWPGAIRRLTPPWQPVRVAQEANSLRDGEAVLALPGGRRWVARHDPSAYRPEAAFKDELASRPFVLPVRWAHTHLFADAPDGTRLTDVVDTSLPPGLLQRLFGYRHRQLAGDLAIHAWAADSTPEPLHIGVTGSAGTVGTALVALLGGGGHRVTRLVRRSPRDAGERQWSQTAPDARTFADMDAVVHLAGASIAGRFTAAHRAAVRESRVEPTRRLARAVTQAGVPVFVSASAIGIYGAERGDETLTESSEPGTGFLAGVVTAWEEAARAAEDGGTRVVLMRTGIVQTPQGGVLRALLPLFRAGLGGPIADGRQWLSWIGIDDLIDVYLRAIVDERLAGPVNAVAPHPATNRAFAQDLGRVLRRPARVVTPAALPALVLGREGAREVALASQRVLPTRLAEVGHVFRHPDLRPALAHLLGRSPA